MEILDLTKGYIVYALFSFGFVSLIPFGTISQKITFALGLALIGFGQPIFEPFMLIACNACILGALASIKIVIIINAFSSVGELIEAGRGMTIGALIDPHIEFPEMPLGILFRWLALYCCCVQSTMLDQQIRTMKYIESWSAAQIDAMGLIGSMSDLYLKLLSISLTFFVAYLSIEFFSATVGKVIPALSLHFESFVLKGVLGYLLGWRLIGIFPSLVGQ